MGCCCGDELRGDWLRVPFAGCITRLLLRGLARLTAACNNRLPPLALEDEAVLPRVGTDCQADRAALRPACCGPAEGGDNNAGNSDL